MNQRDNTYLVGYHQYALYYWYKCVEIGLIGKESLLIHIDLHSDFINPLIQTGSINNSKDVLEAISSKMIKHDSFVIPALDNEIISNILFCCNSNQQNEYGDYENFHNPEAVIKKIILEKAFYKEIILDLDIDFFLDFQEDGISLLPMPEEKIIKILQSISILRKMAKITTIATSPEIFIFHSAWRKEIFNNVRKVLKI